MLYLHLEHGVGCVVPGLLNPVVIPCAHVVGDVTQRAVNAGEIGLAHIQEVRTQASHRHLGNVCEGLADGTAEEENPDLLVEGWQVRVPHKCVGALMEKVDPIALAYRDLSVGESQSEEVEGQLNGSGLSMRSC